MSLDENTDFEDSLPEFGAQGYQYEPEFTEEELINQASQSLNVTNEHERSIDLSWCQCGSCLIMPTMRESTCCKEFEHYVVDYLSPCVTCITEHQDFELICLNSTVLETAYVGYLRFRHQPGRAPDFLSPKQSRLMAYRQFINWVRRGQILGKKFRVVIPACVVAKIRQAYPETTGTYEGFHSASSSDSDME